MNIFGVLQMGQPVTVPLCGSSLAMAAAGQGSLAAVGNLVGAMTGAKTDVTCVGDQDAMSTQIAGKRISDGEYGGVGYALVNLAPDRCPDWVKAAGACILSVAVHDGGLAGVAFATGGTDWEKTVLKNLGAKFKGAKTKPPTPTKCQNGASARYGLITETGRKYTWVHDDYTAFYWSTGGAGSTCEQGDVLILTRKFLGQIQEAEDKHEAAQPQL